MLNLARVMLKSIMGRNVAFAMAVSIANAMGVHQAIVIPQNVAAVVTDAINTPVKYKIFIKPLTIQIK